MPKEESRANGAKSEVTIVSIYFKEDKNLFPAGVFYVFHRDNGEEGQVHLHCGSASSWSRLQNLINQTPGRLSVDVNGLTWWPHDPDYFRLDGPRMRDTILDILEEGNWAFDDPNVGRPQRWDFADRVVEALRFPPH